MLLGGVSWSEIPISTVPESVQSGSEVDFDLKVKTTSASTLQVKTSDSNSLTCKTRLDFSLDIGS